MERDQLLSVATNLVDAEHRREHQRFKVMHRQTERSELNYRLTRINDFKQNQAGIVDRYQHRLDNIQARKDRAAEAMHKRHNSLGGKLQAMTRKGREAQANEVSRLNGRANHAEYRAWRNHKMHHARNERQMQQERIKAARAITLLRIDNRGLRQDYARFNKQDRPNQIQEKHRELKALRDKHHAAEVKRQFQQQAAPSLKNQFQHRRK